MVWFLSQPRKHHNLTASNARQKTVQNQCDVVELVASFNKLINMLRGLMKDAESIPPVLREQIDGLSKLLYSIPRESSPVVSDNQARF